MCGNSEQHIVPALAMTKASCCLPNNGDHKWKILAQNGPNCWGQVSQRVKASKGHDLVISQTSIVTRTDNELMGVGRCGIGSQKKPIVPFL